MKTKQKKLKKYICPDCGRKHTTDSHPPYCQDCILKVTL